MSAPLGTANIDSNSTLNFVRLFLTPAVRASATNCFSKLRFAFLRVARLPIAAAYNSVAGSRDVATRLHPPGLSVFAPGGFFFEFDPIFGPLILSPTMKRRTHKPRPRARMWNGRFSLVPEIHLLLPVPKIWSFQSE